MALKPKALHFDARGMLLAVGSGPNGGGGLRQSAFARRHAIEVGNANGHANVAAKALG